MRFLDVGGGVKGEAPAPFRGWEHHVLDIDPNVQPDVCCDAKEMGKAVLRASYDAILCSHNLEHFYRHEVPLVLAGFMHALKPKGFAKIDVPDMTALFKAVVKGDIDDVWYNTAAAPVRFHDAMYGWDFPMRQGNLFYAHKCGFSEKSLTKVIRAAGFKKVYTASDGHSLHAYAFKSVPTRAQVLNLVP